MQTRYLYLSLIFLMTACGSKQTKVEVVEQKKDTVITLVKNEVKPEEAFDESLENAYATYFVVVADTGNNYYILHDKMFALSEQLAVPVDTMGRYYNATKNLIALPDDDEDDLYAGDYFPRRSPSQNLSLEYLVVYKQPSLEKTMALVAGIYENESSADSALVVMRRANNNAAFKLKSEIYVGCMH